MQATQETLSIADIILHQRLQCRAAVDMVLVDEYAEHLMNGGTFDGARPRVYRDPNGRLWLADGWHRWHATAKAGRHELECDVVEGTFDDALLYAVQANCTHGRQRSEADQRKAIVTYLEAYPTATTDEIKKACKVRPKMAANTANEYFASRGESRKTVHTRTMPDGTKKTIEKIIDPAKAKHQEDRYHGKPVQTVGEVIGYVKPNVLRDAKGRPVPDELRDVFERVPEFEGQVREMSRIVSHWEGVANKPGVEFLALQTMRTTIKNAQAVFSSGRPYIVCPSCHGTKRECGKPTGGDCQLCRTNGVPQGWLPQVKWSALDKKLQAIAESYASQSELPLDESKPFAEDAKGRPVPDELREVFEDAPQFDAQIREIAKIVSHWENIGRKKTAGVFVAIQTLKDFGKSFQSCFNAARPYVVCPSCSGTKRDHGKPTGGPCQVCRSDGVPQGFLPRQRYQALNADLKTIAESFVKDSIQPATSDNTKPDSILTAPEEVRKAEAEFQQGA